MIKLSDKLEAAILAYLWTRILIGHEQLDVLDGMSEGAATSVAHGEIAIDLDRRCFLDLFHGVRTPLGPHKFWIRTRGDASERLMHTWATCSLGSGESATENAAGWEENAAQHCEGGTEAAFERSLGELREC